MNFVTYERVQRQTREQFPFRPRVPRARARTCTLARVSERAPLMLSRVGRSTSECRASVTRENCKLNLSIHHRVSFIANHFKLSVARAENPEDEPSRERSIASAFNPPLACSHVRGSRFVKDVCGKTVLRAAARASTRPSLGRDIQATSSCENRA